MRSPSFSIHVVRRRDCSSDYRVPDGGTSRGWGQTAQCSRPGRSSPYMFLTRDHQSTGFGQAEDGTGATRADRSCCKHSIRRRGGSRPQEGEGGYNGVATWFTAPPPPVCAFASCSATHLGGQESAGNGACSKRSPDTGDQGQTSPGRSPAFLTNPGRKQGWRTAVAEWKTIPHIRPATRHLLRPNKCHRGAT